MPLTGLEIHLLECSFCLDHELFCHCDVIAALSGLKSLIFSLRARFVNCCKKYCENDTKCSVKICCFLFVNLI